MNRLTLAALVAVVAATCLADGDSARFVVQTHSVRTPGGGHTVPVTFKLDSTSGNIWRFTGTNFVQIPVAETWSAGVDQGPKADTEEQRRRAALLQKMDEIVIPEIDFRQAKLHDAITFLQEASVKHDPEKRGMNLILNLGIPPVQTDSDDPFAEPDTDPDSWVPLITFSARQITLHEALKIITQVSNLRYRIEGDVVMIVPFVCHMGEIVVRLYDFLPSTVERIQNYQPELFQTNVPPATAGDNWKDFFSEFGVSWPSGTSIKPVPFIGKAVVCNTHQNLTVFEQVMEAINTYPPRPGRFLLISAEGASPAAMLLLDSDTGHTWRYDVSDMKADGKTVKSDSFLSIPEGEKTPNQTNGR